MKRYLGAVFFAVTILLSCGAQEPSGISGELRGGLRVLPIDGGSGSLDFTLYRGDYIIFEFEKAGEYNFKVPGLEIETVMPRPQSDKSYVKIKKTGDYPFTLGNRSGVLHVVELDEPNYKAISSAEAAKLIKNVNPLILDVRTEGEFNSGHIPGAKLIPVQVIAEELDTIAAYKNEPVFVYCASGNRSTVASRILIDAGFTNVYNLRHGIHEWKREKLPLEK